MRIFHPSRRKRSGFSSSTDSRNGKGVVNGSSCAINRNNEGAQGSNRRPKKQRRRQYDSSKDIFQRRKINDQRIELASVTRVSTDSSFADGRNRSVSAVSGNRRRSGQSRHSQNSKLFQSQDCDVFHADDQRRVSSRSCLRAKRSTIFRTSMRLRSLASAQVVARSMGRGPTRNGANYLRGMRNGVDRYRAQKENQKRTLERDGGLSRDRRFLTERAFKSLDKSRRTCQGVFGSKSARYRIASRLHKHGSRRNMVRGRG